MCNVMMISCIKLTPPLKLLVCQLDAIVVQDATELVLLNVSFSVVVKQAERPDHGPQVASNLQGSRTVIDNKDHITTPHFFGFTQPLHLDS